MEKRLEMTPAEFRKTRKNLGMTRAQIAEALAVSTRLVEMMEKGDRTVTTNTARLMRWWAKHGIPDDWMDEL